MYAADVSQPVEQSPPAPPPGQGRHTALHRAAALGNSTAVAALIQGGCAIDLQDKEGNTALHEVSWHGFSSCVKLLVKAGADVNLRNKAGNTALHLASQNDHSHTVRLLLLGGSTPETRNTVGDSCLHVAARYNNQSVMKILLHSVDTLTNTNQSGDTPLHVAAALNHKRAVQLLLEAGIDATARNHAGETALDKARDHNHKQVALLLARVPQVHRFLRGRTRRKRRERLRAGCRSQSVTRLEVQANKDSSSLVDETPSSDPTEHQVHQHTVSQPQSPNRRRRRATQQAPATRCHCGPLLHKLEDQLKVTQDQFKCDMLKVQEQVKEKMSRMDRRSRHQMKVLDLLNQERVLAERRKVIYSVEQRLAQGQEESLLTQAAVNEQLKNWCVSLLKDVHIQNQSQNYRLLPSPSSSVDKSGLAGEPESLPLLPLVSGGSSTSLASYVNVLPAGPGAPGGLSLGQEPLRSRSYCEMRVDRSSDDYENTAVFSLHDHLWVPGSSSSSSSSSRSQQGAARTLEFFRDPLAPPTFIQERNNLHAKEVTQRFFDAVSTQLDRWYERKVAEVELEAEVRGRRDREQLQQQVEKLEEELKRLKMSGNAESWTKDLAQDFELQARQERQTDG